MAGFFLILSLLGKQGNGKDGFEPQSPGTKEIASTTRLSLKLLHGWMFWLSLFTLGGSNKHQMVIDGLFSRGRCNNENIQGLIAQSYWSFGTQSQDINIAFLISRCYSLVKFYLPIKKRKR